MRCKGYKYTYIVCCIYPTSDFGVLRKKKKKKRFRSTSGIVVEWLRDHVVALQNVSSTRRGLNYMDT